MSLTYADLSWHDYADDCRILQSAKTGQAWVFGVRWLPTMGPRSRKMLLRQLQREQVRWWVSCAKTAGTVGFLPALASSQSAFQESELCCAAMMFAMSHASGTHVLRVMFSAQLYWLVAVNDGQVMSQTDCLFTTLQAVENLQESICRRFAQAVVTEVNVDVSRPLAEMLPFLWQRTWPAPVTFQRLRDGYVRWLLWGGLAATAVLGFGWVAYDKPVGLARQDDTVSYAAESEAELVLSGEDVLTVLGQVWSDLPIQVSGWHLHSVHCSLPVVFAQCRARYERRDPNASNQSLQVLLTKPWAIEPVSLNQTDFVRTVSLQPMRMSRAELTQATQVPAASDRISLNKAVWLDGLQQLSTKTDSIELGDAMPMQGLAPGLHQRSLRIYLAMRDIHHLESLHLPVHWTSVRMDLLAAPRYQGGSRLWLWLEGSLYESK